LYIPDAYRKDDIEDLLALIEAHPLGSIVTFRDELDANHIPFIVDRAPSGIKLIAHVSRNNTLWKEAVPGERILVIFHGAQGYISPNWYPGKQHNENQVPTWNFQVAHVHGTLSVIDDERFVRGVVARLTTKNEALQPHPWKMTDSETTYIDRELKGVVGIEVQVNRLEGKFKLSQNRNEQDWQGAIDGLAQSGHGELSETMQQEFDKRKK
jgi:transcriptional regulator